MVAAAMRMRREANCFPRGAALRVGGRYASAAVRAGSHRDRLSVRLRPASLLASLWSNKRTGVKTMNFPLWSLLGILQVAGWPQRQGFIRKQTVVPSVLVKLSAQQVFNMCMSVGIHNHATATQIIDTCFTREWDSFVIDQAANFDEHSEWTLMDQAPPMINWSDVESDIFRAIFTMTAAAYTYRGMSDEQFSLAYLQNKIPAEEVWQAAAAAGADVPPQAPTIDDIYQSAMSGWSLYQETGGRSWG